MKKKVFLIIIIIIVLLVIFYNIKITSNKSIQSELEKLYISLGSLSGYIDKYDYSIRDINNNYIEGLLKSSREFEVLVSAYNNINYSYFKNNDINKFEELMNNYFDLFIDASRDINNIDYDLLKMIRDDFDEWFIWVEDNYMYKDKQGFTVFKKYNYDDMLKSGLITQKFKVKFR